MFKVPDCQIRKFKGKIYGAGSVIPGYIENPLPNIKPKKNKKKPESPSVVKGVNNERVL